MQSRLVVDVGVRSLVPFPEEPRHPQASRYPHPCAGVMAGLQNEQPRGELELKSRLDGAWKKVEEGKESGPG